MQLGSVWRYSDGKYVAVGVRFMQDESVAYFELRKIPEGETVMGMGRTWDALQQAIRYHHPDEPLPEHVDVDGE